MEHNTLIGIQDRYIAAIKRHAPVNRMSTLTSLGKRYRTALVALGFTQEQAIDALQDAWDVASLERAAERAARS